MRSVHTSSQKTKVGLMVTIQPQGGEGEKEGEEENSEGARVEVGGEEGGAGAPI